MDEFSKNNSDKLISIVLPVYNGSDHVVESIKSVLEQTYLNWELIIVDDCSTDDTPEIIAGFERSDPRVRVFRNKTNLKLPVSLNVGFAEAKGNYFTWTSDDNMYRPEALEKMVAVLEENPETGLVYADYTVINDDGEFVYTKRNPEPSEIRYYNMVGACFMYRRELAEKVGEYDPATFLAEDYDYWLRCYNHYDFLHIHENLYIYRRHEKSLSLTRFRDVRYQTQYVLDKNYELIISKCATQEDKNRYFWSILNQFEDRSLFSPAEFKKIRKKYYKKDKFFVRADRKRRFVDFLAKYRRRFTKILKFVFETFG